jgi:DNA-binding beta-propeller fold protein YncE
MRRTAFLAVLLGAWAVLGCSSSWVLQTESPSAGLQWPAPPDKARIRHVETVRGFKETGASLANVLKYFVFGKQAGNNILMPVDVTTGGDGRIAVADRGCKCVHLYVPGERRYVQVFKAGPGELESPVGVAFDEELRLYVADAARRSIVVFDRQGRYVSSITEADGSPLMRPTGLAFKRDTKTLYVVDTLAHKIHGITGEGKTLLSFGGRGTMNGQFNYPTHLDISPSGLLYVTDTLNFRVQTLDASGAFVAAFGHHGNGSGDFSMPKGVAADADGVVYVVDSLFDNVQLFGRSGEFLLTLGNRGEDHGEFWLPSGIFLDDRERLYVCDTYNHRIQIFQVVRNQDDEK